MWSCWPLSPDQSEFCIRSLHVQLRAVMETHRARYFRQIIFSPIGEADQELALLDFNNAIISQTSPFPRRSVER
jgi:hypothetical protein